MKNIQLENIQCPIIDERWGNMHNDVEQDFSTKKIFKDFSTKKIFKDCDDNSWMFRPMKVVCRKCGRKRII